MDRRQSITVSNQRGKITGQGRGITRDVKNFFRAQSSQAAVNSFGSGARRVENDLGKSLPLLGELLNRGGNMSADPADVGDAIELRPVLATIDGLTIAFNRDDFLYELGEAESEVASAGIKFE